VSGTFYTKHFNDNFRKNLTFPILTAAASVVQWSEFLVTDPEVWVRFPALQDFLISSGSRKGSLRLVSTIEKLLERKSSGSGLEIREYGSMDPSD
jgi:hypothetical protein